MAYQHITLDLMEGALGAEVSAPELFSEDKELQAAAVAEVYGAWLDYHLIVFRDLSLTPNALARFCAQFGELDTYPFVEATTEHPNVIAIVKEPEQTKNFGGAWHTDTSYMAEPPKATCLFAREVPERGGDTLFANTSKAYEALPDDLRAKVAGIDGVFTPSLVHGSAGPYADVKHGQQEKESPDLVVQRVHHPVIRTHPETGRRAIYATPLHCEHFESMSREESLRLLNALYEFATEAQFTTRLKWRPGTLAIWDNRCLFHNALNDYQGQRREMLRVTLKGDVPA